MFSLILLCLYWRIELLTLSGTYVGFLERVKIRESDCYNRESLPEKGHGSTTEQAGCN